MAGFCSKEAITEFGVETELNTITGKNVEECACAENLFLQNITFFFFFFLHRTRMSRPCQRVVLAESMLCVLA